MGLCGRILLALGASLLAEPVSAEPQISFQIGHVTYVMPMPAGYCSAKDVDPKAYKVAVDANRNEKTLAIIEPCQTQGVLSDFTAITSSRVLEDLHDITPREVIARLGGPGSLNVNFAQLDLNISAALGRQVSMAGSAVRLGHDDFCMFQVGSAQLSTAGLAAIRMSAGTCFTAVGGHELAVTSYGGGSGATEFSRLVREAEELARSISVGPGAGAHPRAR